MSLFTPFSNAGKFLGKAGDLGGRKKGKGGLFAALGIFGAAMSASTVAGCLIFMIAIVIGFSLILVILTFVIAVVIISTSSAFVTPSASSLLAFFDPTGGFANPTSCPLENGQITLGSYNPTQENNEAGGHGSTYYWSEVYGGDCYSVPQETSCYSSPTPVGTRCNTGLPERCQQYGYAADVFGGPAGTPVIVPLVNGNSALWSCSYVWTTGGGSMIHCDTNSEGGVRVVYTHTNSFPGWSMTNVPSGTIVTTLFDQGGNTHLHLEARVGGVWVRPENYFCNDSTATP